MTIARTSWIALVPIVLLIASLPAHADDVRVIVKFHGEVDANALGRLGGRMTANLSGRRVVAGRIPAAKLRALRKLPGVAYVEEDVILKPVEAPVDDPLYKNQTTALEMINIPEAWKISKGAGVRVAVLDNGCDTDHEDLYSKVKVTKNFTTSPYKTSIDVGAHGTHTAGTVGAITDNDTGVAGVGYDCELAIGQVLTSTGGYASWVAAGIDWSWETADAQVISMSLSGKVGSKTLEDAVKDAWTKGGVVLCAAAGNSGSSTPEYPAAYTNCISVAAVSWGGTWPKWSNYGSTVDIAAPGVAIKSTLPNDTYGNAKGTSMACPHVAGVAALVWKAFPTRNNSFIRSQVEKGGSSTTTPPDDSTMKILDAEAAVTDDSGPGVTLTAPTNGATVSGTSVTITATTSDTVSYIEFFVDSTSLGKDYSSPYTTSWNSTTVSDGLVAIKAVATDADGGTGSDSITVEVDNVDESPTVAITAPDDNATVSGTVTISATATDDHGVSKVEFYVGSTLVGTDTASPYSASWDTSSYSDGDYTVTAKVTDSAAQTATDSITVTVASDGTETLAADGFESGTFSGGTGDWSGDWSASGDTRLMATNTKWIAYDGSYHVRIRNTGQLARQVDLSGATKVTLRFYALVWSLETSDYLDIRVSSDGGSTYTKVKTFADGDDAAKVWKEYEIDLSSYTMVDGFEIRFEAHMDSNGDYVFLDDVEVVGVPGS